MECSVVGKSVPSIDGPAKVTGSARFTADLALPRMLHGKILRSPHAHARIQGIDITRAAALPGVKAIITGKDTPGVRYGVFPAVRDELGLAVDRVRFVGDPVAAVAAVDEDTAEEAIRLIDVDYEPLPAVFDVEEATREGAIQLHDHAPRNVGVSFVVPWGDVAKGFAEADLVQEDTFRTQLISHVQMEPYAAVASFDPKGRLDVWVPNAAPFARKRALSNLLRLPVDAVQVHSVHIGGHFGGRSELMPGEFCAALLSRRTGRPVSLTYSREETFNATRLKHPFDIYVKTGVKRDGRITAMEIKVTANGGAYLSTGAIAVNVPLIVLMHTYRLNNFRYEARRIYSNRPTCGAMRGHGAQQVLFATESQLDTIAREIGLDPAELRYRNMVETGDVSPSGSRVTSCGLRECIETSMRELGWDERQGKLPRGRGLGMAATGAMTGFGMGIRTGSAAVVKLNEEGQAVVLTGLVENGGGNPTMAAQIAGEILGLPVEDITVITGDTEVGLQGPGSYSMQSTFTDGNAIKAAAVDAREQLLDAAADKLEAHVDDLQLKDRRIFVTGSPDKALPLREAVWAAFLKGGPVVGRGRFTPAVDNMNYFKGATQGQSTAATSYGAVVAEVEVDEQTGVVHVERLAAAHDCGFAINPLLVEGQLEGALLMGQGMAMTEDLSFAGGHSLNSSLLGYTLPTALEVAETHPIIVEAADPHGPFGAKEAAESGCMVVIPAIANAIYDAVGVRLHDLPFTPEKIRAALDKKNRAPRPQRLPIGG